MDLNAALPRPSIARRFRMNAWTVEPARNELRSARGHAVRIEPKVMEVLAYLAARPGEVVPREELLQALWSGLAVGDESLSQTIIKLRKALGDSARHPRYIETVPKRGYRLLAQPRVADEAQRTERRRSPWTAWAAFALLAVGAASLVGPSQPPPPAGGNLLSLARFDADERGGLQRAIASRLTAELGHALAKTPGVHIASAAARGAHYALSGEVHALGEHTRIQVRLAARGIVVWSERFDALSAELAAQPEVFARRIAASVAMSLSDQETRRVAQRYSRDVDAYKLFQSGREASAWRRESDGVAARDLFEKAIAKDPTFARAYAASAISYARDFRYGFAEDGPAALARAHSMAVTAAQIDPQLPQARFALAYVHLHRLDHAEAENELQQALHIDPGYSDAYGLKGHLRLDQGKAAEAIALVRTAMRLSGEATQIHFLLLGRAYYFIGDLAQALINLREATARNPSDLEARLYLAVTLAADGKPNDAQWEAEQVRVLQPGFRADAWLQRYPIADQAMRDKLRSDLVVLGL